MKYIKIAMALAILSGTAYAGGVSVGGYMRGDYVIDMTDTAYISNFGFRNVSISLFGQLNDRFSVLIEPNIYTKSLTWAFMNIKLHDAFQIRYGKMVVPFGVELYNHPGYLLTPDYALVSTATFFGPYEFPGIDVGIYAHGQIPFLTYYLGVFNGDVNNNNKPLLERIEITPPMPLGKFTLIQSLYTGNLDGKITDLSVGFKWNMAGGDIWAEYFSGSRENMDDKGSGFQFTAAYKYDIAGVGIQPVVKYGIYKVGDTSTNEMHAGVNLYNGPFKAQIFFENINMEGADEPHQRIVTLLQVMY